MDPNGNGRQRTQTFPTPSGYQTNNVYQYYDNHTPANPVNVPPQTNMGMNYGNAPYNYNSNPLYPGVPPQDTFNPIPPSMNPYPPPFPNQPMYPPPSPYPTYPNQPMAPNNPPYPYPPPSQPPPNIPQSYAPSAPPLTSSSPQTPPFSAQQPPYGQPTPQPPPYTSSQQPFPQQPPSQQQYPQPPPYSAQPPQQTYPPTQQMYPPTQQQYSAQPQSFQRRKALLVGINYTGTNAQLRGCINDVKNVKNFLTSNYNFPESNMLILTDDQSDPRKRPTKFNMLNAMRWLVTDVRPGDSLFFHYSGHGGQARDQDGDEEDGWDETILPCDYRTAGQIIDDEMNDILVKPLPKGVRLTVLFDSCHSGTALDLPYIYNANGQIEQPHYDQKMDIFDLGVAILFGQKLKAKRHNPNAQRITEQTKRSDADVIMFSGCRDDQTSADASIQGMSTGAMSYAFTQVLQRNRNITYSQLLRECREILRSRFSQTPQLSSSHPMDMNQYFTM